MQQYDNPFSMRASEKMTGDDVFISLFSEASLYSLRDFSEKGHLWGNLTYICSAAGGGKTTMLRCFCRRRPSRHQIGLNIGRWGGETPPHSLPLCSGERVCCLGNASVSSHRLSHFVRRLAASSLCYEINFFLAEFDPTPSERQFPGPGSSI